MTPDAGPTPKPGAEIRSSIARLVAAAMVGSLALAGCNSSSSPSPPSPGQPAPTARAPEQGELPEKVQVAVTEAEIGMHIGTSRASATVASFEITKSPIRVKDYRACVAAGACTAPDDKRPRCAEPVAADGPVVGQTFSEDPNADGLPVTCTTLKQAEEYCRWVGGKLPATEQWMVAARGAKVARYASPDSALADVLKAPTELVKAGSVSLPGCSQEGSFCQVGSIVEQGAIDTVWATSDSPEVRTATGIYSATFGFRCVW